MDDLKNRAEQLMKDATRNGDIDKKTLQKMAESLKSLQELSSLHLDQATRQLGQLIAGEKQDSQRLELLVQYRNEYHAQFLAAGTVIVYAGAIVVTFLFVIMLAQMEGKAAYDRAARSPGPNPPGRTSAGIRRRRSP